MVRHSSPRQSTLPVPLLAGVLRGVSSSIATKPPKPGAVGFGSAYLAGIVVGVVYGVMSVCPERVLRLHGGMIGGRQKRV